MYHFIYKTTSETGKYYIGRHSTNNLEDSGGNLSFAYQGANIASLDSSGNFTTLNNVTAYGTP